jgi:hypothetical protein
VGITSFCAVTLMSLANPSHAAANAYKADRDCTDWSTEMNAVVVARIFDNNGNLKGYANNFTFHVNAYDSRLAYRDKRADGTWKPWVYYNSNAGDMGYPSGHAQYSNETIAWMKYKSEAIRLWDAGRYYRTGINGDFTVQMNRNFTGTTAADDGMVSGAGNACQMPGGTMAPAYAFRDGDNTCHVRFDTANSLPNGAWTGMCDLDHALNNHSWSLSCLGQTEGTTAIKNMYFNFTRTGWDGYYVTNAQSYSSRQLALAGGTWSTPAPILAANNASMYVYFDYREPPAPAVRPTAVLQSSMEEGTNVTAQGFISNSTNSSGTATYNRQFWYEDNGNDTFDLGDDLVGPGNINGSAAFGPSSNVSLGDWGPYVLDGSHTRICTRLFITGVSSGGIVVPGSNPSLDCRNIIRRPYFQVFNGDVDATGVFPNLATGVCTIPGALTGGIRAFNNATASVPSYTGSGTTIAAFSAGTIDGFVSASQNIGAVNRPRYLSFANAIAPYGGGFTQSHCVSNEDFDRARTSGVGTLTVTQPATATYEQYVNGDVYIRSNMSYSAAGAASFDINSVPQYKIVATGNIYILNTVSQLDGVYQAGGKIYTCAIDSAGVLVVPNATNGELANSCKNTQLTINGALIAPEVKLLRTFGTVGRLNGAAETVNFSPEVWLKILRKSTSGTTTTSLDSEYDSITTMPPVL